jgi:hypothetical protein
MTPVNVPTGHAMRKICLVLTFGCAAVMSGALPAAAGEFPFCIKSCDYGGGPGDCSFTSYQQCQATASGRLAYCDANPYFNAKAEVPPGQGRYSRRKF